MKVTTDISNALRKYRFLSGELTQQELANKIGVSRQTIVALEKGQYNPSVALALRLAAFFKVNVEDLFQLTGEDQ
ncbi:MAG: helix-turn-helix transcriptional regulator [Candidatus Marinimicrobia bacterium]|nr:helix-turn-helix transcriptional regulator [Candidatus Neomarinimicrobiota bacterium]